MGHGDQLAALATLSERAAVAGALAPDAPVMHCPGWSVADLMGHLGQVQWFWAGVGEHRETNGDQVQRPPEPPADQSPHAWLRSQTVRLVQALAGLDPTTPLWTWHEPDQTAAFVVRRQVIEAAIHCFDAEHASGADWTLPVGVAELGLIEFADVFQHDLADGATPRPLRIMPSDTPWSTTLYADAPGESVTLDVSAADALLALWGRLDVDDPTLAAVLTAADLT